MPSKPRGKRVTVTVRVDPRRLELFQLQVQRLARRLGISIAGIRVRRVVKRTKPAP